MESGASSLIRDKGRKGDYGALFQFEEIDGAATDEALADLVKQAAKRTPTEFRLQVSDDACFGELVGAAGPGKLRWRVGRTVQMRVLLEYEGKYKTGVSDPFPVRTVANVSEVELEYEDTLGTIFDCHSHWYGFRQQPRSTVCHGPCPTRRPCFCLFTVRRRCTGWITCWCGGTPI